jgi:hypothetical protein
MGGICFLYQSYNPSIPSKQRENINDHSRVKEEENKKNNQKKN